MMIVRQLSVFLENKPGRLCAATDALAREGINLSALTLADMFQSWFERLERENFIVLPVVHNTYNWPHSTDQHRDLCKTKIAKSDAVIIINIEDEDETFIESMEEWARDIDKKILHREDLV